MNHVGFCFFPGDHSSDVLQEIHSALIALASLSLLVGARWTLKAQRGVATRTEACDVAGIGLALRALNHWPRAGGFSDAGNAGCADNSDGFVRNAHTRILERTSGVRGAVAGGCGVEVNTVRESRAYFAGNRVCRWRVEPAAKRQSEPRYSRNRQLRLLESLLLDFAEAPPHGGAGRGGGPDCSFACAVGASSLTTWPRRSCL